MLPKIRAGDVLALAGLLVWLLAGLSCSRKQDSSGSNQSQPPAQSEKASPAYSSKLSQPFPSVLLKDLQDKVVPSDQILEGKNTVVLFVSPTCEPCSQEIEKWRPYVTSLRPPFQVIGISADSPGELSLYAKERRINFPLYSDPSAALVEYFSLSIYPTLVGVTPQRIVKFVRPGNLAGLSPAQYLKAF